ncbi:mitochondrial substrate carrier family protein [Klebsormidium nitens]|uniref:Mitochondrial substrate carrier family protein n=1 Tax=Klebsormidium nitens TaxID=105231 RepID=A0A1Y1IIA1_KLENI|nr:mitochondrial substrate carrier family protein [Klebsormidium nitens]|eukprot:GAQ90610.1 mitochondrial substrate carrier family protein [Klebsormidium nitens]
MRNIPLLERAGLGALAGGLAGGFTNATLHPLDTVKTKLQTKGGTALYTGAWDVVRKVLAKQGIRGFYRGLPAAVVGSIPSSAVYFGTYELGKELLLRLPAFANNRLAVPPFAAAVGNIASSAILVPKELVKQRLQAGVAGTAGGVLASIVREEGVKGLYRGYSAALLRNVPSNVISFSTFEYLKAGWLAGSGDAELQPWQSLLSGAVAGMLSAAATTPLDVVKTRLMTEARQAVSRTGATGKVAEAVAKAQFVSAFTPSGVVSTLRQISAEEGFKGLVRGAGPRIVYGGCFSAMGFLSFETAKHILLERYLRKKEREGLERGEQSLGDDLVETSGQLPLDATIGDASAPRQDLLTQDRIGATKVAPTLSRPQLTNSDQSRDRSS